MPDLTPLGQVALIRERVRLEPLSDQHIEPLRTACAQDPDIWEIYPVSMLGEHFDPAAAFLVSEAGRPGFAVIDCKTDTVVGMTRFINPDEHGVVEIGGTYIAPSRSRHRFQCSHENAAARSRLRLRLPQGGISRGYAQHPFHGGDA